MIERSQANTCPRSSVQPISATIAIASASPAAAQSSHGGWRTASGTWPAASAPCGSGRCGWGICGRSIVFSVSTSVDRSPPLRVCLPLIGCADIRGRGSMQSDSDRVRADLDAIGMRASGSAVGLLQLLKELLDARVLGHDVVERIREAIIADVAGARPRSPRSEEHTSELQSLMRISYAGFCLK